MGLKTPVVILSYIRPEALRQVLVRCPGDRDYLFVSDGWKSESDKPLVLACRELFIGFHSSGKKNLLFRDINLGGPIGIPDALDYASKVFDSFIVLEDDTVPSSLFFDWIDCHIQLIVPESGIGMLSGCNFPEAIKKIKFDQSQLSKFPETWGWATTSKVWRETQEIRREVIANINLRQHFSSKKVISHFEKIRQAQLRRVVWNWDYRLFFAFWSLNYLCLISQVNLITNIGFGDDAANMRMQSSLHLLRSGSIDKINKSEEIKPYRWRSFDAYNFKINHQLRLIDRIKMKLNVLSKIKK